MTAHRPDRAGSRGFQIGLGAGGLMLVLLYSLQAPPPQPAQAVHRNPSAIEQWQAAPAADRDEVAIVDEPGKKAMPPPAATPAPAAPRERPAFAFRFLGKVTDGGATSVVLYASGRTLRVRGTGPVDDEYAVDTFQEGYLILREIRFGTSHMIEFASAQPAAAAAWRDGETPQD